MRSKVLFWMLCLVAAMAPFSGYKEDLSLTVNEPTEWPTHLYDEALREVSLSDQDHRFLYGFPGAMKKFHSSTGQVVVRWIDRPSRRLHPAADCFRASGYAVHYGPIRVDRDTHHWGCFEAIRSDQTLKVCERIYDQYATEFTDVSAWYWHAVLGKSVGPWWAVTVVEEVPETTSSIF